MKVAGHNESERLKAREEFRRLELGCVSCLEGLE